MKYIYIIYCFVNLGFSYGNANKKILEHYLICYVVTWPGRWVVSWQDHNVVDFPFHGVSNWLQ